MKIDGDRLLTWLDEQEAALRSAREGYESSDSAYHSIGGGLVIIRSIRANLPSMAERPKTGRSQGRGAHRDDPDTSREAALRDAHDSEVKSAILNHLTTYADHPDGRVRSAPGIQRILEVRGGMEFSDELIVARRLSDLKSAGLVRDSGERVLNAKGSKVSVWEVVPDAD
ncbi:DNA binding protein [Microbacterium phage Magritte]|nr:DNA binding protein [Microbacterium phage Magritte]